jgi:hypothetical protein
VSPFSLSLSTSAATAASVRHAAAATTATEARTAAVRHATASVFHRIPSLPVIPLRKDGYHHLRRKVTEFYEKGKEGRHFFLFGEEENPFRHSTKRESTNQHFHKRTEKNNFRSSEIYFKGLEIYFKGSEIYFQATKKVLCRAATVLCARDEEFVSPTPHTSQRVKIG